MTQDAPPPTILVIDDDPEIRRLLRRGLELEGWTVVEAGDGKEGLALARKQRPSLVLLDVELPRMSGIEVLDKLKSRPDTLEVPVFMLTGRAAERHVATGVGHFADVYITKPFAMPDLVAQIRRILSLHGG